MKLETGVEVLISQANSCHNGEVGSVYKATTLGALVRVRDCVHEYNRGNLRAVPKPDTIPDPGLDGEDIPLDQLTRET